MPPMRNAGKGKRFYECGVMIIPESDRPAAIKKAMALLEDPRTEVLAVGPNGAAIRDAEGNVLSVTREFVSFEAAGK